jgi:hypothetical protein
LAVSLAGLAGGAGAASTARKLLTPLGLPDLCGPAPQCTSNVRIFYGGGANGVKATPFTIQVVMDTNDGQPPHPVQALVIVCFQGLNGNPAPPPESLLTDSTGTATTTVVGDGTAAIAGVEVLTGPNGQETLLCSKGAACGEGTAGSTGSVGIVGGG